MINTADKMSASSSSSSNSSLPPLSLASSVTTFSFMQNCVSPAVAAYSTTAFTATAFTVTSILVLLPLCILVLYLGFRRWRRGRRSGVTMSHSDIFTFHMAVAELLSVFGSTLVCCGVHTDLPLMITAGTYLSNMNIYGQMCFHLLTCVERYLAVVHPVTYLSLTKAKGTRIRNVSVVCVWLQCFAWLVFASLAHPISYQVIFYALLAFAFAVTSLCSLSVLRVLLRPGPGEAGGVGRRVDQTKLRAFHTIVAILGVLLVRIGGSVLSVALLASPRLGESEKCGMFLSLVWFCLPSSLVLPLLFLQREGKLLCCKTNK